jgi:hypothetical protein
MFRIGRRIGRALHPLAKCGNVHCFPAFYSHHRPEELAGRAVSLHVTGNVLIDTSTLLEDADTVMVGAQSVIVELERGRDLLVGQDLKVRLFGVLAHTAHCFIWACHQQTSVRPVAMAASQPC